MVACGTARVADLEKLLDRYAARRMERAAEKMHLQSEHGGPFSVCILPECASLKFQIEEIQKESR